MADALKDILVDDMDQRLRYTGDWYTVDEIGEDSRRAQPFRGTMHGTAGKGSVFVTVNGGLGVTIYGRHDQGARVPSVDTDKQVDSGVFRCFIDGREVQQKNALPARIWFPEDGRAEHTIELRVSSNEDLDTFHFDYLRVVAREHSDPAAPFPNEWTATGHHHTALAYDGAWNPRGSYNTNTTTYGARVGYEFVGTSLIWFLNEQITNVEAPALGPGLISYSIDGQTPPVQVEVPVRPAGVWRHVLFEVNGLNPGPHRLEVVNLGNSSTVPLGVSEIIVDNKGMEATQSPTKSIITRADDSAIAYTKRLPAKIGGAVGGALGLLLVVGIFFFLRARKRRRTPGGSEEDTPGMEEIARESGTHRQVGLPPPSGTLVRLGKGDGGVALVPAGERGGDSQFGMGTANRVEDGPFVEPGASPARMPLGAQSRGGALAGERQAGAVVGPRLPVGEELLVPGVGNFTRSWTEAASPPAYAP